MSYSPVVAFFCIFSDQSENQDGRPGLWFSSGAAQQNLTKLDRKQDLNVLYEVSVPCADRKTKMDAVVFWLTETVSTSRLLSLIEILRNLTGSKNSTSFSTIMFFESIRKQRWQPWSVIAWGIFDFSSATGEWHFTLCRVELVVQFPVRGSTHVLLCLFPDVLWLWHFLYRIVYI